jgi:hypothetical protein
MPDQAVAAGAKNARPGTTAVCAELREAVEGVKTLPVTLGAISMSSTELSGRCLVESGVGALPSPCGYRLGTVQRVEREVTLGVARRWRIRQRTGVSLEIDPAAGRYTVTQVPKSTTLDTSIVPFMASTICLHKDRPRLDPSMPVFSRPRRLNG